MVAAVSASLAIVSASAAQSMEPAAQPPTSDEIAGNLAQQQIALDSSRTQLAVLDLQISHSETKLDQDRMVLADARTQLQNAEDAYDATLNLYEGRITAIYKIGDSELYQLLFSSEDVSVALDRISYLSTISENDRRLVDQVQAQAEQVRRLHEQVDNMKQASAQGMNALMRQRADLVQQIQTGQSNVDKSMTDLAAAEQRENDEETQRLAAQEASPDRMDPSAGISMMGPSVIVSPNPPAGLQPTGAVLRGVASWYGPGFQGHHTANGEIYNMYGYTAAHKYLPFNTWLKVTYNGRSVFVRINDRGPYVGSRILDLSLASAQAIGLNGIGYVTAEIYR